MLTIYGDQWWYQQKGVAYLSSSKLRILGSFPGLASRYASPTSGF